MIITKYCLNCEQEVNVLVDADGAEFHLIFVAAGRDYPAELDTCDGAFVTSEPPAFTEEDWELLFANAPSDDEIKEMDAEANNFFMDTE